jgi:hypothetical protein
MPPDVPGAYDPTTNVIHLNPDINADNTFWLQVLLHEIGHAMGFTDVYGGCSTSTVMYGSVPNGGPYTTAPTSTDNCTVRVDGGTAAPPPPPPPADQCSDYQYTAPCSPIIVNFAPGTYQLSGAESPVLFDIGGTGTPVRIGWTRADTDQAFLCRDLNRNGTIDNGLELFGNATILKNGSRAENGFVALAEYDENGDGVIDQKDAVWYELLLWRDRNHDGIAQASELEAVSTSDLAAISVGTHWTGRRDQSGNYFRYQATGWITNGRHAVARPVYDIFFVNIQ